MNTRLNLNININPLGTNEAAPSAVPVKIFALATGVLITNLFAPQTLVGPMAATLGIPNSSAGMLAMITLFGYAAGLLFLVPVADLVENRKLVLSMLSVAASAAVGVVAAQQSALMFVSLFALGAACSAIQILMPLAAALTEPARRGQVLGDIMSGLMIGILLSRPIASLLAGAWGWKAFYIFSAFSTIVILLVLAARLPYRLPAKTKSYAELLASLWQLFVEEKTLRDRSISAAIVMAAFNLFWTTIAFLLSSHTFQFNQIAIAIFALVGAGGAFFTPIVGRLADQGLGARVTKIAHILLIIGFGLAAASGLASGLPIWLMVTGLGLSALLLDAGVLGDQTVGRYMINLLNPEARGRINGIFVGIFFIGGSIGSALSGFLWTSGGWAALCMGGISLGVIAITYGLAARH